MEPTSAAASPLTASLLTASPPVPASPPRSAEVAAHEERVAEVAAALAQLSSDLFAGERRFSRLVGEFDALGGWADGQTRSCAHWLNWKLGIAMPAARERVRVARRLRDLPLVDDAFVEGRLSYSKVRAITRVATPATEECLLGLALFATASQLERICRTWRQVQRQADPDAVDRQQQARDVQLHVDEDGCLHLRAVLPPDVGVVVAKAIGAAASQIFAAVGPAEEDEGGRRRADALAIMAEAFLASGASAETQSDVWQMVVHADADVLQDAVDGQVHEPDHAEVVPDEPPAAPADVPGLADPADPVPSARVEGQCLPGPVLRRLACDTTVQALVTRDGAPVGVGRRRRLIPGRMRRLLHRRDAGCQFPGCPNRMWTDAHHIIHWAEGGLTDLDILTRLCRGHHTLVHARGMRIAMAIDTRRWTFHHPDGTAVDPVTPLPAASGDLPVGLGLSHWQGDPARMSLIIDALVQAASPAARAAGEVEDVSAETPPDVVGGDDGRDDGGPAGG